MWVAADVSCSAFAVIICARWLGRFRPIAVGHPPSRLRPAPDLSTDTGRNRGTSSIRPITRVEEMLAQLSAQAFRVVISYAD